MEKSDVKVQVNTAHGQLNLEISITFNESPVDDIGYLKNNDDLEMVNNLI